MKQFLLALLVLVSCASPSEESSLDIQGHRGARGLFPENSIPAFLHAAELGVTTLELDLSVSADRQLVVSHEPYFSPAFCLDSLGNELPQDSIINIYQLAYGDIQKFDCGSKVNERFPDQKKMTTVKPLLRDLFETVEAFVIESGRTPLLYNIELKTAAETDTIFHPAPADFSDLVYNLITEYDLWDRVNIQSFDFRTLQYFRQQYPQVRLALLIENELPWRENIDSLGFTPEIYSCYYPRLSKDIIGEMQVENMMVIPWTVNEQEAMRKLIDWGVDGIITDYPDRALSL